MKRTEKNIFSSSLNQLLQKKMLHVQGALSHWPTLGSLITYRREPRSCLGQVFNSKLGCISTLGSKCMAYMQPLLKLKTWHKARPAS
jgi:hypothetical protein